MKHRWTLISAEQRLPQRLTCRGRTYDRNRLGVSQLGSERLKRSKIRTVEQANEYRAGTISRCVNVVRAVHQAPWRILGRSDGLDWPLRRLVVFHVKRRGVPFAPRLSFRTPRKAQMD